jgi:hypothetical protein
MIPEEKCNPALKSDKNTEEQAASPAESKPKISIKDGEIWYSGEEDLLDSEEGRAVFCRVNETSIFRKKDPDFPQSYIEVYNVQNISITVAKRSRIDPTLTEVIEYDAEGKQLSKSFSPALETL